MSRDNCHTYFVTGNGNYDGISDFGDSIVKLGPPSASWGPPLTSYTPGDQSYLGGPQDEDLGSGGVLLLPDLPVGTAHYQRLIEAGKQGIISVVDRNAMGGYCCATSGDDPVDTDIVQEIPEGQISGMYGSPSYWNGQIYFGAVGDYIKAFSYNLTTGAVSTTPVAHSSFSCGGSGHYSCSTSISSNGTSNGILWALDSAFGYLYALNASTLAPLYDSDQTPARDSLNGGVKYEAPTVANGKVYVGSNLQIGIYGEGPPAVYWAYGTTPYLNCNGNGSATASAKQNGINSLSWTFSSTNGPKLVYAINWKISDSKGVVGSGSVSGSSVDLSGNGTVSRTPVGAPTFSGTLSFWTTVGTCTAPFSIAMTGTT